MNTTELTREEAWSKLEAKYEDITKAAKAVGDMHKPDPKLVRSVLMAEVPEGWMVPEAQYSRSLRFSIRDFIDHFECKMVARGQEDIPWVERVKKWTKDIKVNKTGKHYWPQYMNERVRGKLSAELRTLFAEYWPGAEERVYMKDLDVYVSETTYEKPTTDEGWDGIISLARKLETMDWVKLGSVKLGSGSYEYSLATFWNETLLEGDGTVYLCQGADAKGPFSWHLSVLSMFGDCQPWTKDAAGRKEEKDWRKVIGYQPPVVNFRPPAKSPKRQGLAVDHIQFMQGRAYGIKPGVVAWMEHEWGVLENEVLYTTETGDVWSWTYLLHIVPRLFVQVETNDGRHLLTQWRFKDWYKTAMGAMTTVYPWRAWEFYTEREKAERGIGCAFPTSHDLTGTGKFRVAKYTDTPREGTKAPEGFRPLPDTDLCEVAEKCSKLGEGEGFPTPETKAELGI